MHVSDEATTARIAAAEGVVEIMAGLKTITREKPAGNAINVTVAGVDHALANLTESVDAGAEQQRLTKRMNELTKQLGNLKGRLGNKKYVDKAPPHLVEETRRQLHKVETELAGISETLRQNS